MDRTTSAARPRPSGGATTVPPRGTTRPSRSTTTTSSTTSASPSIEPSSSPSSGLSTAAIGGIGAAVGLLALFVVSVFLCKRRRARIYARRPDQYDPSRDPIDPNDVLPPENKYHQRTPPPPGLDDDSAAISYPMALRGESEDRARHPNGPMSPTSPSTMGPSTGSARNAPAQPYYPDNPRSPTSPRSQEQPKIVNDMGNSFVLQSKSSGSLRGGNDQRPSYDQDGSVVQSELSYRQGSSHGQGDMNGRQQGYQEQSRGYPQGASMISTGSNSSSQQGLMNRAGGPSPYPDSNGGRGPRFSPSTGPQHGRGQSPLHSPPTSPYHPATRHQPPQQAPYQQNHQQGPHQGQRDHPGAPARSPPMGPSSRQNYQPSSRY